MARKKKKTAAETTDLSEKNEYIHSLQSVNNFTFEQSLQVIKEEPSPKRQEESVQTPTPQEELVQTLQQEPIPQEEPVQTPQVEPSPTPTPQEEIKEMPKVEYNPVEKTLNVLFTHVSDGKNVDINSWIVHHLNLGFSHIYILNIGDRLSRIAFPDELVSVINTNKNMSLEDVMNQSYNFSSKYEFDWMLYLRPNEYLHLSSDLNTFLSSKKDYDQVMISNRSILNMKSENKPNNCSNYYFTFSDMSYSYINGDLKNFVISK